MSGCSTLELRVAGELDLDVLAPRSWRRLGPETSLPWPRCGHRAAEVVELDDREPPGRFARAAVPGAVVYSTTWALLQVAVVAAAAPGLVLEAGVAAAATAGYLPFYVRHVLYGVRGARPPHGALTLAVMSAVVFVATPWVGADWLPTYHVVAVSALFVLRRPWSGVVFAAVVAVQVPIAFAFDSPFPASPSYYAVTVLWRASSVFVPIWLAGAVLQLSATRRELAEQAIVRERLRIDVQLRETVAPALSAIVRRGETAGGLLGRDTAADELNVLVDDSRRALADARLLMSSYQPLSARRELDTAAVLLQAAGIRTRLVLSEDALEDALDEHLLADLRSTVARLLRDDRIAQCVLAVVPRDGRLSVEVQTSGEMSADAELAAP